MLLRHWEGAQKKKKVFVKMHKFSQGHIRPKRSKFPVE